MNVLVGQAEGIPNITGSWNSAQSWNYWSSEGCIYAINNNSNEHNQSNNGARAYFDAEKGRKYWELQTYGKEPTDTIYGASQHVTVLNFTKILWKRIN